MSLSGLKIRKKITAQRGSAGVRTYNGGLGERGGAAELPARIKGQSPHQVIREAEKLFTSRASNRVAKFALLLEFT